MTKLYYTDPLKAIWMQREFGVSYTHMYHKGKLRYHVGYNDPSEDEQFTANDWFDWIGEQHMDFGNTSDVHPDSMYIFEPMAGDMLHFKHTGVSILYASFIGYTGSILNDNVYLSMDLHDSVEMIRSEDVIAVIQRDGKAFFMPEVEDERTNTTT